MSNTGHLLRSILISIPFMASAQAAIDAHTQTGLTPEKRLNNYCARQNMNERAGQLQCLQETAGQVKDFVTPFHAALFSSVGVAEDPRKFDEMLEKWRNKISPQEEWTLTSFHLQCGDKLMAAVFMPEEILKPENPHTTAFNLPKYCIDTATSMAGKYKLSLDWADATRLKKHMDYVYDYFKVNPVLPAAPAPVTKPLEKPWGQDENESGGRRDYGPGRPRWTFI